MIENIIKRKKNRQGNLGQQSTGTTGGGGSQSSAKAAEDTSSIPTSMMHLFQQFLESMGKKDAAHTTLSQGEIKEKEEQGKSEREVPTKEIVESSGQGEARGNSVMNGLYCYRCLTRGHPKECWVDLFCEICENASHIKG
jgi:hypothetical protein